MKSFVVKYRMKQTRGKYKSRIYSLIIRAVDEKDSRRIAYNMIDNRFFEII